MTIRPRAGKTGGLRFRAAAGVLLASLNLFATSGTADIAAPDDIFQGTNLLRIRIDIPPDGMRQLRGSRPAGSLSSKPKAWATVTEGGRLFTNVIVQVKGFTTFKPIDDSPSLTLHFDKAAPAQKFHGLAKISLNNSAQDPSRLHEKISRELFAAAGVPVPRSDYAIVNLNGRKLGLFVLTEGYDRAFLKRHFQRAEGNLYDGGVLHDIDRPLELNSGKASSGSTDLTRLLMAAQTPDVDRRFSALEGILDMNRFLSMMAMEVILCHSDSYSLNRNNYRVYHDPATDRMVFMPHGMDRVLGAHRSPLDLSVVPPMMGLVARAVLSTPEGRRRYVERAGSLYTNVFQPASLCRRVRELEARIAGELGGPAGPSNSGDGDSLCRRISARAADLKMQFGQYAAMVAPVPILELGPEGIARLEGWRPRRRVGQPEVSWENVFEGGKPLLHLRSSDGPLALSLRTRLRFPAGTYRLTGQIKVKHWPSDVQTTSVSASILRYSPGRFDINVQPLNAAKMDFAFQVSSRRAPEEIEFICDIQTPAHEIVFDSSSLELLMVAGP